MTALVFDCDGVLIASNQAKSEAFYRSALPYGEAAARALVAFHQTAGSISRRARFQFFFDHILERAPEDGEIEELMAFCSRQVVQGTLAAPKVSGVVVFLEQQLRAGADLTCVSGIESGELERLLAAHHLLDYFRAVWGGRPKAELLVELVESGEIQPGATYYGDTEDDLHAARGAGLKFVLVAGVSEWQDGPEQARALGAQVIQDFRECLEAAA